MNFNKFSQLKGGLLPGFSLIENGQPIGEPIVALKFFDTDQYPKCHIPPETLWDLEEDVDFICGFITPSNKFLTREQASDFLGMKNKDLQSYEINK